MYEPKSSPGFSPAHPAQASAKRHRPKPQRLLVVEVPETQAEQFISICQAMNLRVYSVTEFSR